ncbi:MAG: c-type cytochrome [Burkholderiaceae bacterium]|nr:c-type cytochrome [Burkholderiaceae bacterium]
MKRIHVHWTVGLGLAATAATMIALALVEPRPPAQTATHRLQPGDASVIARGERVYRTHCAACHGARLEGQPNWRERGPDGRLPAPPHDASGHTWHHPDEMLFKLTKYGLAKVANMKDYASAMPVYEGVLSDEEIVAVLSWIKAQWPADVRERHDQMNRQARP